MSRSSRQAARRIAPAIAERCSRARGRFATPKTARPCALRAVLPIWIRDGRLRRDELSGSCNIRAKGPSMLDRTLPRTSVYTESVTLPGPAIFAFDIPKASALKFHQSNGSQLNNALLALRKHSRVLRHRRAFADCFGANPVASALGNPTRRDPGRAVRTYHEG